MIRKIFRLGALASIVFSFGSIAMAQDSEIVASLDRLEGRAQVIVKETNDTVQGRNGLLLKDGDTVVTKEKSQVTIKFRDGSEVRLFPKSQFVIQATKETKGKQRSFSYSLFLKLGSIWGRFAPQRQVATVGMPTATIGIKGTTLRATHRDNKGRVALTEGRVEVKNERSRVDLAPGQRLPDFSATDDLTKIVQDIPLKVDIKSEKRKLSFPGNQPEEVFVTLQLINIKSGAEVHRPGKVYFRSDYGRITYPPVSNLNQRGFARVPLKIAPPAPTDDKLDGNVFVWAVIDEEIADDTAEGKILFTIPVRSGKARIRVESNSGEGKKVQ